LFLDLNSWVLYMWIWLLVAPTWHHFISFLFFYFFYVRI
jgi:hypothetical protein